MTDYKMEPTDDELLDWAGEEQFFLFCDKDEFLQIARAVMHRYIGRKTAVQGEPVAEVRIENNYWNRGHFYEGCRKELKVVSSIQDLPVGTKLYAAQQPAEQQSAPAVQGEPVGYVSQDFLDGKWTLDHIAKSDEGQISRTIPVFAKPPQPAPDESALVESLEQVSKAAPNRGPLWHGSEQIVEARATHPTITHCDNCGCDWLDNGLNPIGCPYCKQPTEPDEERLALEAVMESVDPATWPGLTTTQRCALGRFAKPQPAEQQPAPDESALVTALERVTYCNEVGFLPESVQQAVSDALAAYRKGGRE